MSKQQLKSRGINETISFYFSEWTFGRSAHETMDKNRMWQIFTSALKHPSLSSQNRDRIFDWMGSTRTKQPLF